jgi:hypothetical protein
MHSANWGKKMGSSERGWGRYFGSRSWIVTAEGCLISFLFPLANVWIHELTPCTSSGGSSYFHFHPIILACALCVTISLPRASFWKNPTPPPPPPPTLPFSLFSFCPLLRFYLYSSYATVILACTTVTNRFILKALVYGMWRHVVW